MENKVIILSAPSGCGKTTILKALMARQLPLEFSVSATSRQKRDGETDGRDYYFFTPEQFMEKVDAGEFLEWNEVYAGQYYGTLLSEVDRIAGNGHHVIFDVDVKGGLSIKERFGDRALAVFVMPPSIEVLRQRLLSRGTETPESVEKRLQRADYEISFSKQFDYVLVNDDLDTAIREAYNLVNGFLIQ
ncbi:MAG: guanylate kinase [Bacteroidales bacterium]|nr:guanylate kinase [Bacteroidales bacterium]